MTPKGENIKKGILQKIFGRKRHNLRWMAKRMNDKTDALLEDKSISKFSVIAADYIDEYDFVQKVVQYNNRLK